VDVFIKEIDFVEIVNGVKQPVFSPGYQGRVQFPSPIPPDTYKWGTEGVNCSSPIYWSQPFTISAPVVIDPGTDPGQQNGDYVLRFMTHGWPGDMKLDIVPNGNGYRVTDLVTSTPKPGYHVVYVVNEKAYFGLARLVNYQWDLPSPLSVRKGQINSQFTALYMTGGGNAGDTVTGIDFFNGNTSYAQIDVVAVKQNA